MLDNDKLSEMIISKYGRNALSAELIVYRYTDNQIVRDTVTIDFSENDYQHSTSIKPIYTE